MTKRFDILLIISCIWLTGCGISIQAETTPTMAHVVVTASLPPISTLYPTKTFPPPSSTPTVIPVSGTTSTQLNVRAEPSTVGEVFGVIPANSIVQIIGKDPGENWWQILYPNAPEGKGWVTAQFIKTVSNPEVPVAGSGGTLSPSGYNGIVIQQLNIRSGPGTNFNSLGIVNANDVVILTGKNSGGTWFQIEFKDGPDGKGWVNAGFVKTESAEFLSIVSEIGDVIGTETPVDTPLPPSPTVVPAPFDFDSAENPLITVNLGFDTQTVMYTGEISTPDGDTDDWVLVSTTSNTIFIGLECSNGNAFLEIRISGTELLACNQPLQAFTIPSDGTALIHIKTKGGTASLEYTKYTLTLQVGR